MITPTTAVLVFRTHKNSDNYLEEVHNALESFGSSIQWNLDLDDPDKILRVETDLVTAGEIIAQMQRADFFCEELED